MDVLQQELMTVYNLVPDLFPKRPADLSTGDKLKLARALLDLAEKLSLVTDPPTPKQRKEVKHG